MALANVAPCRTLKRKRSEAGFESRQNIVHGRSAAKTLDRATHVLATEATALGIVAQLYQTDPVARTGLVDAVDLITMAHRKRGKVVVCGVGKSGLVGSKMVATMKSLGIGSSFLHAAEAVHGDLGDVRENDVLLFISYSGRTAELLNILPHIPKSTPMIALTSHTAREACPLLDGRPTSVLLPAPIHEPEEVSFGVAAPTTSTTVAMAVGDMLALTVAEQLLDSSVAEVFKHNHPGGAIGETATKRLQIHDAETLPTPEMLSPRLSPRSSDDGNVD
ncbi:hypothetical protein LTR50_006352 [Elasticomyces elasticus]|nr:hypothetical protein LTR50_006352 [Elasticomyces elasticus]